VYIYKIKIKKKTKVRKCINWNIFE
jgi:hypothetical protein